LVDSTYDDGGGGGDGDDLVLGYSGPQLVEGGHDQTYLDLVFLTTLTPTVIWS
jgi:hypothetical protein